MLKYSETFMKKMKVLKETTANNINKKKQMCFSKKNPKNFYLKEQEDNFKNEKED